MRYTIAFTLIGAGCVIDGGLTFFERGREVWPWGVFVIWLGIDLIIVGVAHWRKEHRMLGKRPDGTIAVWSWILFLPLHAYTTVTWHVYRWLSRKPASQVVTDELVVGRRLLGSEVADDFENYVDLTAEFREPVGVRGAASYLCFPILDGAAPEVEKLREVARGLKAGRTFVHCALGHGRTGLFALAVLLERGVVKDVEEGLRMLRAVRPGIELNEGQRECVERYAREMG